MAEVKILVKGYAREEGYIEKASSAVTLIKEKGINILVDTGMNRKLLLESLNKENLSVKDIDYIILTHTHIDHCLLAGIFENALIVDDSSIYSFSGEIQEHNGKVPKTDIEIIKTPGHDQFHCSVLVNDNKLGKVVIAADVFWWKDDEEQKIDTDNLLNHKDPYVKDEEKLKSSRKKILKIADYIIPGHGNIFKVNK